MGHAKMIRAAIAVLLLFPPGAAAEQFTGKVVGITDGDTIKVLRDGKEVRVRLYGIDCPEKGQPFGQKAKQATSNLAFGKLVTVRDHGTDRYGRLLGEVVLPDGPVLNQELLRSGFAWWYKQYVKDKTLEHLEAEAREAKKGLWADANPTPPWDWRKKRRAREESFEVEPNGVAIIALLPDPKGRDENHEAIRIGNSTARTVNLKGWKVRDRAGHEFRLSGEVPAAGELVITVVHSEFSLNNDGDEVLLLDADGIARSEVLYTEDEVRRGEWLEVGD